MKDHSKNRDRLLGAALAQPRVKRLLSTEHFSADGTLIEARASMKSFKPKDRSDEPPSDAGRNAEADFRGEKRSNATMPQPPIRTCGSIARGRAKR